VNKPIPILLIVGAILLPVFSSRSAQAALVLTGFGDQSWDRIASPGETPRFTISIDTDGGPNLNGLFGMQVGIRIEAAPSSTGTLSFGSATIPTTNRLFDSYTGPIVSEPAVGTTGVTIENFPASDLLVIGPKNAFDFTLQSIDALGVFEIYAMPEFTNYFTDDELEGVDFANLPTFESGGRFLLGTVTVTAVPEPSSVALLGVVAAVCGGVRYRRRRFACQKTALTSAR